MRIESRHLQPPDVPAMREITINGTTFQVHALTGRVASTNKQLETRVSGGGGGGMMHQGSGYSSAVHITSTTVTHDQIFLVDDAGSEHALRLQNWDIACREGNQMTAVWLIKKGKTSGNYVAIRNHSIDETKYDDKGLAKIHRPAWPLAALVVPFVLQWSALSLMVVAAALIFRHIVGNRGRDELKASGRLLAVA
jgi:hypothetical protein